MSPLGPGNRPHTASILSPRRERFLFERSSTQERDPFETTNHLGLKWNADPHAGPSAARNDSPSLLPKVLHLPE